MASTVPGIESSDVQAKFDSFAGPQRDKLLELRALIYDCAAKNPAVGSLQETLKWGEPSYLTPQSKSGTTIRISARGDDQYAMFVHCQTDLLDRYRQLYDGVLTLEGNRAILFHVSEPRNDEALRHCIDMALSYHLR